MAYQLYEVNLLFYFCLNYTIFNVISSPFAEMMYDFQNRILKDSLYLVSLEGTGGDPALFW